MPFFEFPDDAHWNDERGAVEFSVILRPYEGTVRIAAGHSKVFLINPRPPNAASRHSIFSGRDLR
jgi:hypothetical protein